MRCNSDCFDIERWDIKNFSVSCYAKHKKDNFPYRIVTVYSPSYDEKKYEFLIELQDICSSWDGPTIIGGDFNLVRCQADKSNGVIDHGWCDKFNGWIDGCGVLELNLVGRKFT